MNSLLWECKEPDIREKRKGGNEKKKIEKYKKKNEVKEKKKI